uniref:MalT-like TPR region domain-containing protein n=1 Tax=Ditylum brightwellii TaxID=49249 RepID=A0A7S1YMJ8_9STRA
MSDTNKIAAMKFLHLLILYTFLSKQDYLPIVIIQSMQLTLNHGICKESCVALASCSYLLCEFQDFEGSEHIGSLSTGLLERSKAQEYRSQVHLCVYGGVYGFKNLKLCVEPLMDGYRVGMQTGDIQHAMFNANCAIKVGIASGLNLKELERSIKKFGKEMIEYKQTTVYTQMQPMAWAVSDLIHSTDENNMERNSLLKQAVETNSLVVECDMYIFGAFVAYIYNNYDLAAYLVQKRRELEKKMSRKSFLFGLIAFYDGLIFLAMAQKSSEFEWTSEVSDVMSKIDRFVQIGKSNNEHKLLLLEAETKSRLGETDKASKKYELAIAAAEINGFVHEQAIANERAADFFLRNNDRIKASQHYGRANHLYIQWGAQGKANNLCKNIPF